MRVRPFRPRDLDRIGPLPKDLFGTMPEDYQAMTLNLWRKCGKTAVTLERAGDVLCVGLVFGNMKDTTWGSVVMLRDEAHELAGIGLTLTRAARSFLRTAVAITGLEKLITTVPEWNDRAARWLEMIGFQDIAMKGAFMGCVHRVYVYEG